MNRKHQVISLFLLFLMAFHAGGYLVIFSWQQNTIKQEMQRKILAGIPNEQLVLLKIPIDIQRQNTNVFKQIDDHEFRYLGNYYDVVRSEQVGKTTWYYCIQDKMETKLADKLTDLKTKDGTHNPLEKNKAQTMERILLSYFVNNQPLQQIYNDHFLSLPTGYFFSMQIWTDRPLTPPPKV